jgi:hypothetical protein
VTSFGIFNAKVKSGGVRSAHARTALASGMA